MISALILDFDGVILESVAVKGEAFRDLFAFAPGHTDEIVAFHHDHGGMSRFEKFRYIYKNILKEELTDSQFQLLSDRFSSLVLKKILTVPFVNGAESFLHRFHPEIPLYIVSATPQEELAYIVAQRGLTHYFRRVLGSPESKEKNIALILKEDGLDPGSVVFVGDALNDWQAARSAGIRFIGRIKPGDPDRFSGNEGIDAVVKDMDGLSHYLEGRI
jgi:HAD superfamily hydrolase (TIGR01549 family)